MDETAQKIIDACEADFEAHKSDCSGFVKAVATVFQVPMSGQADSIVDQIHGDGWTLISDTNEVQEKANDGWFIVAGMKSSDHVPPQSNGHVAMIVSAGLPLQQYPTGYWGQLGAVGVKKKTINWAWNTASRDGVIYAGRQV
jgi:hypothetical protein